MSPRRMLRRRATDRNIVVEEDSVARPKDTEAADKEANDIEVVESTPVEEKKAASKRKRAGLEIGSKKSKANKKGKNTDSVVKRKYNSRRRALDSGLEKVDGGPAVDEEIEVQGMSATGPPANEEFEDAQNVIAEDEETFEDAQNEDQVSQNQERGDQQTQEQQQEHEITNEQEVGETIMVEIINQQQLENIANFIHTSDDMLRDTSQNVVDFERKLTSKPAQIDNMIPLKVALHRHRGMLLAALRTTNEVLFNMSLLGFF